eukprot:TRINITY_DN4409_c0_g1_i1.p1 TRINITY_DN4409_c0_g1~~TRINITY_DN4409_c0_g1_i1.p1  ORF type:complete len:113 (-),score=32.29 TRINITY_DN4409_c0_g1_i1:27-365(-)
MVLLENDPFLTELTKLFAKTKTKGTVFLSMKKYEGKEKSSKEEKDKKPSKSSSETVEPACLIRATNGKMKISTLVHPKDVVSFQIAYANILKSQMDALKRKEKKKSASKKTV